VLLVEKSEALTFKVLPPKRKAWQSVIEEHGLDSVTTDFTEKEVVLQNSNQREHGL